MTLSVGKEEIKKINCCDKCRAWSMKFKSDVYPCHNTDCECHISTPVLSKPVKILDDLFNIPGASCGRRWESLSIEEKIGALAEKLDEVIKYLDSNL